MPRLILVLLTFPLILPAQRPLQPCVYGLPCINAGGSPDVVPNPDNQLARIIEGVDPDQENLGYNIHRCDGLAGDTWLACNFVNVHGCSRPGPYAAYSAPQDPRILSLVARACGWK